MSLGSRIPLEQAQDLAHRLGEQLEPLVARIQVAGSVRRKRPVVSDIEFVIEPRPGPADLFGGAGKPDIEPIRRLAETWGTVKRAGDRLIGIANVLGTRTDCELYLVHPPTSAERSTRPRGAAPRSIPTGPDTTHTGRDSRKTRRCAAI